MRIGAYQFNAAGSIEGNYSHIKKGIDEAERAGVITPQRHVHCCSGKPQTTP